MYKEKRSRERVELADRLVLGFGMLGVSQGMVQFADSKAGGLLLINSLLMTGLMTALGDFSRGAMTPSTVLAGASLASCAVALGLSFRVMRARGAGNAGEGGRSLVYYRDVAGFRDSLRFIEAFRESDGERVLDSLLASHHALAGIAQRKFVEYRRAETATFLAALLWVAWVGARVALA